MLRKAATFFVSFIVFIFVIPAQAELRVMAINAEWLWSPYDNEVDGSKFNRGDMKPQAYEAELNFYAGLIKENKVDLLALSEIENASVARDLARKLGAPWQAFFKQGRDTATGQDVALLSHLKHIKGSETDFDFPAGSLLGEKKAKRLSKVLGARFYHPETNRTIGVVTSHFLSKRNDSPKKARNRLRQAYALNKAISKMRPLNDMLLVLGDFNDTRGSAVISTLEKENDLNNAESSCQNSLNGLFRKSVDHILFSNMKCLKYGRLGLKKFSDHQAVLAIFE